MGCTQPLVTSDIVLLLSAGPTQPESDGASAGGREMYQKPRTIT